MRPIIDFSIPPDVVYDPLAAWQLLTKSEELTNDRYDQQIIIIASGGYPQAGVTPGEDNFPVPLAVAYWRERLGLTSGSSHNFTGSDGSRDSWNWYGRNCWVSRVATISSCWNINTLAITFGNLLTLSLFFFQEQAL